MQASVSPGSLPDSSPLVSIVLPSYNGERFLTRSIESCLNQTHSNIELILVDDCSEDNTLAIMRNFASKDKRVSVIRNEKNSHIASSLNKGFAAARGEYFTWTSDDNYYDLTAIETMLNHLLRSGSDIVFSGFRYVNEFGKVLKTQIPPNELDHLVVRNIIGACFLYKKEIHIKNNGYSECHPLVEDFHFWLTTWKNGFKFQELETILYSYTIHANSLTATKQSAIHVARFDLIWNFRILTRLVPSHILLTFCRRLYKNSVELQRARIPVFIFCLRKNPKMLFSEHNALKLLKFYLWGWLPLSLRMHIKKYLFGKNT